MSMCNANPAPPSALWITRTFPFPPTVGGDLLYSRNMLEATALSGVNITAMVLHVEPFHYQIAPIPNLRWIEGDTRKRPDWQTIFSALPNCSNRYRLQGNLNKLFAALHAENFNAIIFDSHATAGFLDEIKRWRQQSGSKVRLIYVAHNHQASTQQAVAEATTPLLRRIIMRRDAVKTAALEDDLVRSCDGMTAITIEDRALFETKHGPLNCVVATPAYNERRLAARDLFKTDRTVSLIGNFFWVAKRINLEAFLTNAEKVFPNRSIRLRIAGNMTSTYLDQMRARFPWATFLGRLDSLEPELDMARIGVIPDCVGGGFKLRSLGYAFNRVPIAGVANGLTGTQLTPDVDFIAAEDMASLVARITEVIDDLPKLSAVADRAYSVCEHKFGSWLERGEAMKALIEGHQFNAQ